MKSKEGFIFKKFEAESQFHLIGFLILQRTNYTYIEIDEAINWLKELDKE